MVATRRKPELAAQRDDARCAGPRLLKRYLKGGEKQKREKRVTEKVRRLETKFRSGGRGGMPESGGGRSVEKS